MPGRSHLARKSFFVDARVLRRAKRALGVKSDAEAVRLALDWLAGNEEHWKLLIKTSGTLGPNSFRLP
ncbi:MAG: hypothetical protein ACHQ17_13735 [Polyangia bacterium]|jgi:Arc/MetJ family transcription regulator